LIRNNQLQEGINLYRTALDALPEPWNSIHDTISFNLGLAHIRFVQYQEAKDILGRIKADPSSSTGQRVAALIAKLDHALRTQTHLQFASDSDHDHPTKAEEFVTLDLEQMMDSFIPIRGDICCYRIFQAQDLATESTRKLRQNMPKLVQRPSIRRTESIPHKMDRSNAS
jgi:hypothetical protein